MVNGYAKIVQSGCITKQKTVFKFYCDKIQKDLEHPFFIITFMRDAIFR